jgi:hypothetical protein
MIPVVMRFGMREERVTVRQDTTPSEMVTQLMTRFQAGDGEWVVGVETDTREPAEFKIVPNWRYTLDQLQRPVIHVTMRYKRQDRTRDVPLGTTEGGMKQLLVSGFGVYIRKSWRVVPRSPMGRVEKYELKRGWTYELVEYTPPIVQESFRVMAYTRLSGTKIDFEIETGWSEGQIHERCREEWHDELGPDSDGSNV